MFRSQSIKVKLTSYLFIYVVILNYLNELEDAL